MISNEDKAIVNVMRKSPMVYMELINNDCDLFINGDEEVAKDLGDAHERLLERKMARNGGKTKTKYKVILRGKEHADFDNYADAWNEFRELKSNVSDNVEIYEVEA